jgi:hypothetical protein
VSEPSAPGLDFAVRAPTARYLAAPIATDLRRKMVFLGGPRQVGKTSLARALPPGDFWFFDEIHKYRGWRNYLKGLVDECGARRRILVTGSARLDLYRFGGDSLQGRYFYLRLHPFSVAELGGHADTLPERVGSPLSINSLREDLQLAHPTLARWVDVLERVYGIFRIAPFGAPKLRAVKKERKHYHYDGSVVAEPGPRFENLVASHLLKWVEHQIDTEGRELEAALLSRHRPARGGLRDRRAPQADRFRRVQARRRSAPRWPAIPEGALCGRHGVAGVGAGPARLRQRRRDSRRAGVAVAEGAGLTGGYSAPPTKNLMIPLATKPMSPTPSARKSTKVPNLPAFDSRASWKMMNTM